MGGGPTLRAQSPSSSSSPEALGSLNYPLGSNLSLKPGGPEPVWGDEKTLQRKGLGAGASAGTPTGSSFLSLQQGQTHGLKGGCCPPV